MGKYSFGAQGPTFNDVALTPAFASVTTTATPATGSCGVQFEFKDVSGKAITSPISGILYLSATADGLSHTLAGTSIAKLTNGTLSNLVTKGASLFTTTAAGLLGLTITAVAGDYYIVFVKPDGSLLISDVCTCS